MGRRRLVCLVGESLGRRNRVAGSDAWEVGRKCVAEQVAVVVAEPVAGQFLDGGVGRGPPGWMGEIDD